MISTMAGTDTVRMTLWIFSRISRNLEYALITTILLLS